MSGVIKNSRGFSLMELLVAITILVIAILPLAYFYSKMLANVEQASIRTRAIGLANERIAELRRIPPGMMRANNTPNKANIVAPPSNIAGAGSYWGFSGPLDMVNNNFYYDPGPPFRSMQYFYSLPAFFNPYDPRTQGYNNSPGINHYDTSTPEYEYEPVGFTSNLTGSSSVLQTDARRNPAIDSPLVGTGGFRQDIAGPIFVPRTGSQSREELYQIYGRRTVIMEVVPEPMDDDNDGLLPDDPFDGGVTVYNPYPPQKGPANKFEARSKDGSFGFQGWVTVFWLPANAPERYLQLEELNYVQVPFFFSATNVGSELSINDSRVTLSNKFVIS